MKHYITGTWYNSRGGCNDWDYCNKEFDNLEEAKCYFNEVCEDLKNGAYNCFIDSNFVEINITLSDENDVIESYTYYNE